jgi:hypothetical protein
MTYRGTAVVDPLLTAQRILDVHIISCASGRCVVCGSARTCAARDQAMAAFARAARLPSRRPGASHPELLGARRVVAR